MDRTAIDEQGYVHLDDAPELMKLLEDIFTDEFMQQHAWRFPISRVGRAHRSAGTNAYRKRR